MATQVLAVNFHPLVKQYLQMAGLGTTQPQTIVKSLPAAIGKQPPNLQTLTALANMLTSYPGNVNGRTLTPSNILTSLTSDAYLSKYPNPSDFPPVSFLESLYGTTASSQSSDASLVNSLVLALLILSNLLNLPPESSPEANVTAYPLYEKSEPIKPISVSYAHPPSQAVVTSLPNQSQSSSQSNTASSHNAYYSYEQNHAKQNYESQSYAVPANYDAQSNAMPNSNFLGSSSFLDFNPLMSSVPVPSSGHRNGLSLMSPYEALSPSSPFSDSILSSPYGMSMNSKLQSPYSMLSETKDVLNFSDFF
ncbi:unnamed protein product [Diatraea saccharalis]|uniref:Uncharacterized protein n=1 Tax=Diatraea saccharalis TaxID=40085 RepID=A0A9N9RD88_9NEOP|nr:unnamed protein product [Diatraea saccharalis]